MKAVLLSTRPNWCKKILDGEKTVEVRRTCPVHVHLLHFGRE